ncbi:MAG: hypothetical protein HYZ42_06205 [Bacteroidetes bacterium]|nr:hypothetical protein [Bacteroidota bacterium]
MNSIDQEEKTKTRNKFFKRFGIGTIIFFVVKGTISTILIIYTGKGIWTWISKIFE